MSIKHVDKTGIEICVGSFVKKATGEANYKGWIVSCYTTMNGSPRCVVDVEPQRFQMICTPHLLEVITIDNSE